MRYFYDCEFLEDGSTIELISIGIVAADGREYYAVNADMPMDRIKQHQWLWENVVPSLPVHNGELDYEDPRVLPSALIAQQIADFLTTTADNELWAYYGAYDHVALCQLWGTMMHLPNGVPMFTHELMQLWQDSGKPPKPRQESEHDALADARWNRELFKVCGTDDEATVDRVAHAIHQVQCGCDGSLHTNTTPDLSPYMAEAAIRELLGGDQ